MSTKRKVLLIFIPLFLVLMIGFGFTANAKAVEFDEDGVVEEGLRHRQVPHPVVHVGEVVETVEELVVVAERMQLRLRVTQLVDRLLSALLVAGGEEVRLAKRRQGETAEHPIDRLFREQYPKMLRLAYSITGTEAVIP